MSRSTIRVDDALLDYIQDVSVRETDVQRRLREETAELEQSNMQIAPEQGQFMQLLAELTGVERAIEIGTFTGYSALCIARALPEEGELIACDVSEEWTSMARRYWREAGVDDRIDLRLQPALETLETLLEADGAATFDFAFIDADKSNYGRYYDHCLELVRTGGLIAVDNTLWGGSVVDPEDDSESTEAIRALNERIADDDRVTPSLVPIGDGVMLARKR
jgi:predicted O-methyltransferase YrrM